MGNSGKAARVIGFLVLQLGAGVMLDSRADVWGALAAVVGAAVFAWGLVRAAADAPVGSAGGTGGC